MLQLFSQGLLQASVNTTSTAALPAGSPLWLVAVELAVGVAGIVIVGTVITRVVRSVAVKAGASKTVATSITQWMGVIILLGAVAVATTITGLSSQLTALTVSGIAGLAISLALQTTISNVIAGVLMQHDGVIRLGDDIQFGQGGVRGVVLKLSLRTTWLKTSEGVIIMVGNSNLSAGPILNYSAKARVEQKLEL